MVDFNNLIEQHLERINRPRTVGRYYPSEAGLCLRKVWYGYDSPKPIGKKLMKIFQAGHMVHDLILDVLLSEKTPEVELLEAELPIKIEVDGITISGRIDDLIMLKESGEKILVEVKSCSFPPSEPKPYNQIQLQLYMYLTGVHSGVLLYVEKNTLRSTKFKIDYNEAEALEAVERFKIINAHLKAKKIPLPEAKRVSSMKFMCEYCEYRKECDAQDENDDSGTQQTLV